jgi:hypothetical protein
VDQVTEALVQKRLWLWVNYQKVAGAPPAQFGGADEHERRKKTALAAVEELDRELDGHRASRTAEEQRRLNEGMLAANKKMADETARFAGVVERSTRQVRVATIVAAASFLLSMLSLVRCH